MSENTTLRNMSVNEIFKELIEIVFGDSKTPDLELDELAKINGTLTKDRLDEYRRLMNPTRLTALLDKPSVVEAGSNESQILDMYANDNKKHHNIKPQESEREFAEVYPTTVLNNPWLQDK